MKLSDLYNASRLLLAPRKETSVQVMQSVPKVSLLLVYIQPLAW